VQLLLDWGNPHYLLIHAAQVLVASVPGLCKCIKQTVKLQKGWLLSPDSNHLEFCIRGLFLSPVCCRVSRRDADRPQRRAGSPA
jgi:hypothetical protein